jgi:Ca2+/Na+ antiporter
MPAQSSLSPPKTTSSLPSQSPSSLLSSSTHYHKVSLLRAITIFIISIFYVGFLSTSIVTFSELIISSLGINASTLGATIVALGMTVLLLFHK